MTVVSERQYPGYGLRPHVNEHDGKRLREICSFSTKKHVFSGEYIRGVFPSSRE